MNNLILTSSFNTVAKELYDKGLLPKGRPRVAFVKTAAMCYKERPWMDADRKSLTDLGYEVEDLDFNDFSPEELMKKLDEADIIFVAGGNTVFLTKAANDHGFFGIVRELLAAGKIYVGSSAGSILVGPSVAPFLEEDLDDLPKDFKISDTYALGLVDYIILPHHPQLKESDDKAMKDFGDKYRFVTITDREYKIESI